MNGCCLHKAVPDRVAAERSSCLWNLIPDGDRLMLKLPGGGGMGDRRLRDPGLVARDVRDGLVTPEKARRVFGFVVER